MGSREIWKLQHRQSYSFIGIMGRNDAYEKKANNKSEQVSCTKVFVEHIDETAKI